MFTTPENNDFYSRRLYQRLDRRLHQIRLLRVHPKRLDGWSLVDAYPKWVADPRTDAYQLHQATVSPRGDIFDIYLEDFICCELQESLDLETADSYAALSYCCGAPNKTRKILVDGYLFNAFANLEHSLDIFRKLQSKTSASGSLIWTDQVCINQPDIIERSHQVGIMWNIYHKAEIVYAVLSTFGGPKYLTDIGNASAAVGQFLEELARRTGGVQRKVRANENAAINGGFPSATDEDDHTSCRASHDGNGLSVVVRNYSCKMVVARTLQEFMAAKSVCFLIHMEAIQETEFLQLFYAFFPMGKLSVLYGFMLNHFTKDAEEGEKFKLLGDLLGRRTLSWASNTVHETLKVRLDSTCNLRADRSTRSEVEHPSMNGKRIFGILSAASNRAATDERDMVYATAAILGKAYEIKADYGPLTTIKIVLTLLAKRLLEVHDSPRILDYAWKFAGRGIGVNSAEKWKPSPGLPTWIPDWTRGLMTEHEVWGNDYSGSIEGGVFAEHDRGVGTPFVAQFVYDSSISEHLILRTKGFPLCKLGERAGSTMRQYGPEVVVQLMYRTSLPNSTYALGQDWSCQGDELWSLHDSDFLYVLRRKAKDAHELIGRAQLYEVHNEGKCSSLENMVCLRVVFIEDETREDLESCDWSMICHHISRNDKGKSMVGKPVVMVGKKLWINIV